MFELNNLDVTMLKKKNEMSSVKEYRKDILAGDFASICVEL